MRKRLWTTAVSVATAGLMVGTIVAPAQAAYVYLPGERLYVRSGSTTLRCTGAYTIAVGGQAYQVTAGHCGTTGSTVRNDGFAIGYVARNGYNPGASLSWDTSLVKITAPGATAWQQVIDPVTRKYIPSPKIYGLTPTRNLVQGFNVAKGGTTTGFSQGPISAYTRWGSDIAYCAQMRTLPGDSGGPVFRRSSVGLEATGIVVAYASGGAVGCFIPIDDVLRRWGGYMSTYSGPRYPSPAIAAAAAGQTAPEAAATPSGLSYIDPSLVKSAALP